MSFTISDFETRLVSKMHSIESTQIADIFGLITEAAGNVLLEMDPRETKRITQIDNALYDNVYSYVLPTDLKGDAIVDIRPQKPRSIADNLNPVYARDFNRFREGFNVQDNAGVRTINISGVGLSSPTLLHDCESLTSNGIWSTGGSANSLSIDTLNKIQGNGSIKFNIGAVGTTAHIENFLMTAVDLSLVKNAGSMFVWVYIPSITAISAVTFQWGSSIVDYYTVTVTASHDNTAFVVGWNLLRFPWIDLTPVGTPDDTAIDFARLYMTHDGNGVSSCRIDNIVAVIGSIYEIEYYSKCLFRNSSGTWLDKPTALTDLVNLDIDSFNVLLYEAAYLLAQELQKKESAFDVDYWERKKKEVWDRYKRLNKSQRLKPKSTYYKQANTNIRRR